MHRSLRPASSTPSSLAPLEPTEELELVRRIVDGDERALSELHTRYQRLALRCITRVTRRFSAVVSPEDASDIYANFFLALLAHDRQKLRSFDPSRGTRLSTWLGMLATHAAYDHLRSRRREPLRDGGVDPLDLVSPMPDPFENVCRREHAELAAAAMADFSAKDRRFAELYFGEELDAVVVARRMQISVKTVYTKKHKLRARLESRLSAVAAA